MKTEEMIALSIPIGFAAMVGIERLWPARKFPEVKNWHWIGLATFVYAGLMNAVLPTLMPLEWAEEHRVLNLSGLGTAGSVIAAHLIITFVTFAWHRATHEFGPLWRGFHQLHHAPRHLNVYAANVNHPADLAVYIFLPTLVALWLLGLNPMQAAIVGNLGALNAFFQHWNVRTPRWLGLFFQRPEAHCIHHARGVHRYNYSDFPLWDMIFGTYRNPESWEGETGFDDPNDARYGAMLAFVDVNANALGSNSFGQDPSPLLPSL